MKLVFLISFIGFVSGIALKQGPTAECTSTNCFILNAKVDDRKLNDMIPDMDEHILAVKFTSSILDPIPATIFTKFPSLLCIMATSPGVSRLVNNTFENASSLQFLYLPGNQIKRLPMYAFKGASNLNELNLTENQIEAVSDNAFQGLEHLENLSLRKNRILYLGPNTFKPLYSLKNLDLSGNKIEAIDALMFVENPELNGLNVANNHISTLSFAFLTKLPQIRVFNMMGNPCIKHTVLDTIPLIKIVDGNDDNNENEYALNKCYLKSIDWPTYERLNYLEVFDSIELAREDYEDEVVSELNDEIVKKQKVIDDMVSYEHAWKTLGIILIAFVAFLALCKWVFIKMMSTELILEPKKYAEDKKEETQPEEFKLLNVEPIVYTIKPKFNRY